MTRNRYRAACVDASPSSSSRRVSGLACPALTLSASCPLERHNDQNAYQQLNPKDRPRQRPEHDHQQQIEARKPVMAPSGSGSGRHCAGRKSRAATPLRRHLTQMYHAPLSPKRQHAEQRPPIQQFPEPRSHSRNRKSRPRQTTPTGPAKNASPDAAPTLLNHNACGQPPDPEQRQRQTCEAVQEPHPIRKPRRPTPSASSPPDNCPPNPVRAEQRPPKLIRAINTVTSAAVADGPAPRTRCSRRFGADHLQPVEQRRLIDAQHRVEGRLDEVPLTISQKTRRVPPLVHVPKARPSEIE